MVSQTNEQALEAAIQRALTGTNIESTAPEGVAETPADYVVANNGFKLGLPPDYSAQYAIDEKFFWKFINNTREEELKWTPLLGPLSAVVKRIPSDPLRDKIWH